MKLQTFVFSIGMIASTLSFSVQNAMATARGTKAVAKQVKHELNMLPYVNVFDYMTFAVDANGNVTLAGEGRTQCSRMTRETRLRESKVWST